MPELGKQFLSLCEAEESGVTRVITIAILFEWASGNYAQMFFHSNRNTFGPLNHLHNHNWKVSTPSDNLLVDIKK